MSRPRLRVAEKFIWRGYEFKLSRSDSVEAHWQMKHGPLRARLLYRDIGDPEAPPEFTAIIQIHDIASASGVAPTPELALAYAERHLTETLRDGVRILSAIRRGKPADPE
jgi:hypothetical protein